MDRFGTVVLMILFGFLISQLVFGSSYVYCFQRNIYCSKGFKKKRFIHRTSRFIGEIIVDAMMLNLNLFSIDSVKVITGFTPLFLGSRMIDESLQENFYDCNSHTNIYQFPKRCHDIAHYTVGVPMVFLSTLAFWGWNEDLRMTGRLVWIGLPFVHLAKEMLKKIPIKSSLRPWSEEYARDKRAYGGLPSGHMANLTFMTALFGMRHGPAWAVPLGLYSTFVFANFLNCNRHYLSQLFAGVGLGLMFAFAANKIIDQKLDARYCLNCMSNVSGGIDFKLACRF